MKLTKAHSENHVAALVSAGWTLKTVFKENGNRYEFVLCWQSNEEPKSVTEDNLKEFQRLSVVEAFFGFTNRGVVLVPGIPKESLKDRADIKVGDELVLVGDQAIHTRLESIEMVSPPKPFNPILLPRDINKEDVHSGMEVWHRSRKVQPGGR